MIRKALKEFYETPIMEVMQGSGYILLPENTPVLETLNIMIEYDRIWVEQKKGSRKLTGVLTRKDVIDMLLPPQFERSIPALAQTKTLYYNGAELTVADLMGRRLITVNENVNVQEVLQLMRTDFVRRIPIVKDGLMLGEVSMKDLIERYLEILEHTESDKVD